MKTFQVDMELVNKQLLINTASCYGETISVT